MQIMYSLALLWWNLFWCFHLFLFLCVFLLSVKTLTVGSVAVVVFTSAVLNKTIL